MQYGYSDQGRRNSIISGEATSNIANFFALFPKKLVCQPLISGEAAASPASPVPTPLCKYIKICRLFKNVLIFQGIERISDITGKPELYYPEWKRNAFRYFVTVPVIVFCLTVVFVSVFLILELQVKKYVPQKSQFDISNLILQINVFHIVCLQ